MPITNTVRVAPGSLDQIREVGWGLPSVYLISSQPAVSISSACAVSFQHAYVRSISDGSYTYESELFWLDENRMCDFLAIYYVVIIYFDLYIYLFIPIFSTL